MHFPRKRTRSSDQNKFAAFEFPEEEDCDPVNRFSAKKLSKSNFKKQKKSTFNSPLDKYNLLKFFTRNPEFEKSNSASELIDVDGSDSKMEEPACRLDKSGECSVTGKPEFEKSSSAFEPIDVDGSDYKMNEPACGLNKSGACSVTNGAKSDNIAGENYNPVVPFSVEHIGDRSEEMISGLDANVLSVLSTCIVTGQAEFRKSNNAFEPIDVDASDSKLEEATCRLDKSGTCSVSNDAKTKIVENYNSDVPLSVEHIDNQNAEMVMEWDANVLSGLNTCVSRAKKTEHTSCDYKNSDIDLNCSLADMAPINVDSDDDHSVEKKLLASDSRFSRCEGLLGDDPSGVDAKLNNPEVTVIVDPDNLDCGDISSMVASLTFSSQGIRLVESTHLEARRSLEIEWAVSDIVSIKSVRWESLAEITFYFKADDTMIAGIESVPKIVFWVSDPNWAQREEAIRSLHCRYESCWNLDPDITSKEGSVFQSNNQVSNHYPAKKSNRFIVFPKGDPDAVSLSERDIELLLPKNFINDTIVDFYIKYIENRISQQERQRFHFFNSFFFRKLADLDKDVSGVWEGTLAFQHVRKWTKNVDLFAKDFIFIPVNFSLHWSLIIICHPGEVTKSKDELQTSIKVPCILHMDSIRGCHRGLGNILQDYLLEEWKERHDNETENISENFGRLPFISLELPQQQNSFDCGLFLLHYVELFLEMTSVNSNTFNLAEPSNFPQKNWFPPAEASEKRFHIRKLILEIFETDSLEDPVLGADVKYSSSDCIDKNISAGSLLEKLDEREVASCADSELISVQGVPFTSRKDTPLKISHRSGKFRPVFADTQQDAQVVADKFDELSTIEEEREDGEEGEEICSWTEEAEFEQSVKVVDVFVTPERVGSSAEQQTNAEECQVLPLSESENVVTDENYVPLILAAPTPQKENHDVSDMELESYVVEDSDIED